MKILWVNNIFLHPTTKGGQIRTLEMLKCLSSRHEIHYVAYDNPRTPEGMARAGEYAARAYGCPYRITRRFSLGFFMELARNLFSREPALIYRRRSPEMRVLLERLVREEKFDSLVCDFLTPSVNVPRLEDWVVFQHNVETMIFRRYAETARDPARRWYFHTQAERLFRYERDACRGARHVIAVSEADANTMRKEFGATRVTAIPTGVDLEYFAPREQAPVADLVFVGSMDWLPNIDGMAYFTSEILPLIRRRRPECSVAVVGRDPVPPVREMAARDRLLTVTGTVPDVRPYLWGAKASIVPLRIGGGTRLKIYESMAARIPVVSTTIGAEGLEVQPGENIYLADTPEAFAERCLELLDSASERERLSSAGWRLVAERFSWEQVASQFEAILNEARGRDTHASAAKA
jgi:glycosyltransferase involved in cell wall biosynthesis